MDERELMDIFTQYGAISKGHFKLSSGRHSDTYVQCTRVLQYPRIGEKLADELASHYQAGSVDVVLSPALGGVVIGLWWPGASTGASSSRRGRKGRCPCAGGRISQRMNGC